MSKVTLETIYEEVKSISDRLRLFEDLIEEIIVRDLPRVKLGEKEIKAIRVAIQEMKKGNYVKLEALET
ncbi:MAG: hypothetical protein DRO43_04495 [Candidatus Hecatellales archaeon]|nr:MAG: hypothetical protein DRO43_04495 [Candidatus Hecatellales archaeon]